MERSETGPYRHAVQLRFSDTDAMGHVNNARFVTYLEDARIRMLHASGIDPRTSHWILARTEIDYVSPIELSTDEPEVQTWVEALGRSSATFGYLVTQGERTVARARSVIVGYDYTAGHSRALTDGERANLSRYAAAPSGAVP